MCFRIYGRWYVRPDVMGSAPDVLHKANYSRDPTEVTEVALTTYMLTTIQSADKISPIPSPSKREREEEEEGTIIIIIIINLIVG